MSMPIMSSPVKLSSARTHMYSEKSGHQPAVQSRLADELIDQHFKVNRTVIDKLFGKVQSQETQEIRDATPADGNWGNEANFIRWANACAGFEKPVYYKIASTELIPQLGDSTLRKPDIAFFRPGCFSGVLVPPHPDSVVKLEQLSHVTWETLAAAGEAKVRTEIRAGAPASSHNSDPVPKRSRPTPSTSTAEPAVKRRRENERIPEPQSAVDVVAAPPSVPGATPASSQRWCNSRAAVMKATGQATDAAYHLFQCQPDRQYSIHWTVNNEQLRIWLFNRSGRFEIEKLDLNTDAETCQWIFYRLPRLTSTKLGFIDILAPLADHGKELIYGDFVGKVKEQLHCTNSIASRATATYRVEGLYKGAPFDGVMKMSWVDEDRHFTEEDALRTVREAGGHDALVRSPSPPPSTAPPISPTFSAPQQTAALPPGLSPETQPTTTSSALPLYRTTWFLEKAELAELRQKHPQLVSRKLSIVFLSPAAKPIQDYRSVQDLLHAFIDAVEAHKWLYEEAKVLHRDVSVGNIMLQNEERSNPRGLLIDLDLAIPTVVGEERKTANHRTGTYPFLAYDLLENGGAEHLPRHDLESFFYVLVWICTFYGAPEDSNSLSTSDAQLRRTPAPTLKPKALILKWQAYDALTSKSALGMGRRWNDVVAQTDPFWRPLVDGKVLDGLRKLFVPVWDGQPDPDVPYEKFLKVLDDGWKQLEKQ